MKDNIIVNSICEYIKDKILSKEMFPGYRIVEDELANELGVSRTPLRRALAQLQYDGFLYIVPNRGTFVVQSSYEDIEKIYAARVCLEEGIAPEIIREVTDEDIAELKDMHKKFCEIIDDISVAEYSSFNKDFHMRLADVSNNEYLKRYLEEIHNRVSLLLVYYDNSMIGMDTLKPHAEIIEALEKRDVTSLIKALKKDAELANYTLPTSRAGQRGQLQF